MAAAGAGAAGAWGADAGGSAAAGGQPGSGSQGAGAAPRGKATSSHGLSSWDLECLTPQRMFGAAILPSGVAIPSATSRARQELVATGREHWARGACEAPQAPPRPRPPASLGRRRGSGAGCLTFEDLDDLHPHLMYGALLSSLTGLYNSVLDVAVTLLSWRLMSGVVAVLVLVQLVLPMVALAQAAMAAMLAGEIVFFVWLRYVKRELQRVKALEDRLRPPDGPLRTFQRSVADIEVCAAWRDGHGVASRSPEKWVEGWFRGQRLDGIMSENMREFFAWAFYTKRVSELQESEMRETEAMLREFQGRFGLAFEQGYNPHVRPILLNFDSLKIWGHPLCYYLWIGSLRLACRQSMRLLGYQYFAGTGPGGLSFFHYRPPPAPGVLLVDGAPHRPEPLLPLVLIHGLGVGLAVYLRFIRRLTNGAREVFVIELPEVSQSCTRLVLAPDAMAEAIARMLRDFGHERAVFVAHSYGTFVLSWVIRAARRVVAKAVMLDPVSLLLSQPDVAFNFLYRKPTNAFSIVVANFVRGELFSANVLMRHFYWYHNVLWGDELPAQCLIALSGQDDITNAHFVRQYVEERSRRADRPKDHRLKLLWYDSFFHGEILVSKPAQLQIMAEL